MTSMRAALWTGAAAVAVVDVPVPEPAADEALVRVHWTGLCGSDLEEYLHGPVVARPPRVLGHEIAGVVQRPAADGSGPGEGTPVVVDVVTGCGRCAQCARHREGLCPSLEVTGQHRDGGLAELVVARASRLVPVPGTTDLRHAALAEPLAVAVRAVRSAGSLLGRRVAVLGGGTVGLLVAQVALRSGAAGVAVLEPADHRRGLAGRWGAAGVWADDAAGRRDRARLALHGEVDVVVECAGVPGAAAEAVALCGPGGTALLLGVTTSPAPIDVLDVVLAEKTVRGSSAHMWDDDVAPAVALIADGRVDVAPLVSHVALLADVDEAFRLLADPTAGTLKLLVDVRP